MKKFSTMLLIALGALATVSCNKEIEDVNNGTEETVKSAISFKAVADAPTKATLTDDYDANNVFVGGWEEHDAITVDYGNNDLVSALWDAENECFRNVFLKAQNDIYAYYPDTKDGYYSFSGSDRKQEGNKYDSYFDLMYSDQFSLHEGENDVVVPMHRATAIQYFHLTADDSDEWANLKVQSATLTVTGDEACIASSSVLIDNDGTIAPDDTQNSITISFYDGDEPTAKDVQLWFNVLPCHVESMTITVELEDGYTWTKTNDFSGKGYTFEAGQLGYVKGAPEYKSSIKKSTLGPWKSKPISGSNALSVKGNLSDSESNTWSVEITGTDSSKNPSQSVNTTNLYWQLGANGNTATAIFKTSEISGTITKVSVDCAAYQGKGTVSVTVGGVQFGESEQDMPTWSNNDGSIITFAGNATGEIVVTMAATTGGRAIYLNSVTVSYIPVPSPDEKALIGIEATGIPAAFWTGDEFNATGVTVTALWEDESTTDVTTDCSFSGYDMNVAGDQTVTVSYKGETTTYNIHLNTIANTKETAYTASEAVNLIDAGYGLNTSVYVKGTVSEIVTAFSSQYGNISFNVSEGGKTFQFFRNFKGADKEKWSSENEAPVVGDVVVGYGKLTKYNSTYEFTEGNYIVDITRVERGDIEATLSISNITVKQGEDITPAIVTNVTGEYTIEYSSDNEDVVIADGDELVCGDETGTANITATLVAEGYTTAKTTFTITVTPTGSDPVYTLDATNENNKGTNNSYASSCDIEVDGITWNVTGNSTMIPWRIGGKNITEVDRTVYSKTAYAKAISSIDLTLGTASNVTINSCKLVFSTNEDFSNSSEVPFTYANDTISITRDGGFPANSYFKFVFNVTIGGTNRFIEFKKVEFYE